MPTLLGMRRRGFTPRAIRDFCDRIGVTKKDAVIDMGVLENCARDDLERTTKRALAVLRPLRVVIENFPQDRVEELDAPYHPTDAAMGSRKLPFTRVIYIEQDDFRADPPKKYFRLAPGREVRLRYAYIIRCDAVIEDPVTGEVVELRCSYDPETRSGVGRSTRKVKGTIHWVSADHGLAAEARLYDRLFTVAEPMGDRARDFKELLNPDSMEVLTDIVVEPSLRGAAPESRYQFERQGYFCVDRVDSSAEKLVFNRTVSLRDSWAKIERTLKTK
jgi:glutaminyl-tRNA synthetase